jgi:dephospho-CoA kinase
MREHDALSTCHNPLVVGVTGAAGSGKSTVTGMLAALGAQTVDADAVVRWAYRDPGLLQKIARRFGVDAVEPDGSGVCRERLAEIVFPDPKARADLEAMVHPAVLAQMSQTIEEYRKDPCRAPMLALEIPLLYETGADAMVDAVIVAMAPPDVCARRLEQRGWSPERIRNVQASQMPVSEKAARADYIIDASGSLDDAARQVADLWNRLTSSVAHVE